MTVNTPFDGVDFIESLLKYFPNFIGLIQKSLRLQSINELSPNRVRHVLANLKSKPQFPIRAYKGFQPTGYNIMDASFLSPIFYLTGVIVGLASDGVVTHSSALKKLLTLKILLQWSFRSLEADSRGKSLSVFGDDEQTSIILEQSKKDFILKY